MHQPYWFGVKVEFMCTKCCAASIWRDAVNSTTEISSHCVPGVIPMAVILENGHLPFRAVAPSDAGIFLHQA